MSSKFRGAIRAMALLVAPTVLVVSAAVMGAVLGQHARAQEASLDVVPAAGGPAVDILEPDLSNPFTWAFAPTTLSVPAGATVTWTNRGVIGHSVTAIDLSWDSDVLLSGGTYQRTFDVEGEVTYFCRIHPWATGTVIVLPSAAADAALGDALTDEPVPDEPITDEATGEDLVAQDLVADGAATDDASPTELAGEDGLSPRWIGT